MDECLLSKALRNCQVTSSQSKPLLDITKQRIETITHCSKTHYHDGLRLEIEEVLESYYEHKFKAHRDCMSTYTSKQHIERHLKRKACTSASNISPKRRRRSGTPSFEFLKDCVFCGAACELQKDYRHPARWRPAYIFRQAGEDDPKRAILETCDIRNDKWASEVRFRIEGAISDLHAADAMYHVDCQNRFMTNRNVIFASSSASITEQVIVDQPFEDLINEMNENPSKIWNSIELFAMYTDNGGNKLTRRYLIDQLSKRHGYDLLVLKASGVASILLFKSKAPALLKLVSDSEDTDTNECIKTLRKIITKETDECGIDRSKYSTRLTNEAVELPLSATLMNLLSQLSPKLDNTPTANLIGSIVFSVLKNFPTPLQIALGVMVRDSKTLQSVLSEYSVTCTYDELQRFKKSAAKAATTSIKHQGITDCKSGLIQTIIDNFDADISSQNGKKSTHSLAMLVTQSSTEEQGVNEGNDTIKRIDHKDQRKPIEYEVIPELYNGPKKPNMPLRASQQNVPSLKLLAEMTIASNRAKEADTSFMSDVILKDKCSEFNGYNMKESREQGHTAKKKTKSVYLPLIDMKPADPSTIKTAMKVAKTISMESGQDYTVMTGDMQLYKIAVNILWTQPDELGSFVVRLGGMHTLMSFIGAVGSLMGGSGLVEVLESTFGGVHKMVTGKKYSQNMRAFRLLSEELLRPIFEEHDISCYANLTDVLKCISSKSKTSKQWIDCFIMCVFIMMRFVRAEREGDWSLHLASMREMMPYFFAAGHMHYARYGLYYLRSMAKMPKDCQEKFMKGEHVMRHRDGVWNSIWSDMFIETTFMRHGHGKKGIIGITLKPETLKTWSLSLHTCGQLESDLLEITEGDGDKVQESHKEERPGRIKSDGQDRDSLKKKLQECIHPLKPQDHPQELVNVVSGHIQHCQ